MALFYIVILTHILLQGAMEQVIAGNNIRCVTNNSKEDGVIHGVMDDPKTESFQFLFQLKPIPR
jgi:hypothetical protein